MEELFTKYSVRWDFTTKLCASIPADPNLVAAWQKARQPKVRPPGGRSIDEINEEVLASLPESDEVPVNGLVFQREGVNGDRHLCVRAATVRAHMKDCARVISSHYVGKIEGERSFAVKVKNCVYHDETQYWLPILRPDGSRISEADGTHEKAIHVTDARGRPMNAIKLFEFVYPVRLDFTIKVLAGAVKPKDLDILFTYGGVHGYAGERSDGEGRYTFTLRELTDQPKEKGHGRKNKETPAHAS
jgi:hypothetical protein